MRTTHKTHEIHISNPLKTQIITDFETLLSYSNELWKLRIDIDQALDNLETSLKDAEILHTEHEENM